MRWYFFILLLSALPCQSQTLVSTELLETYDRVGLEQTLGEAMRTGISLYQVNYLTTGSDGAPDTASGLVVMPDVSFRDADPIVAYQHGTTDGPDDVPSRLTNGHIIPMAYGGQGYIVSAADYLGLGDSRGFHPYVHAATQASAAIDLLLATQEMYASMSGKPWDGQLFVSGYSQGGHAAAALQRELEGNWTAALPVTASTPMSGPYSLSGVMFDLIVSDEVYFYGAFIVYVILGYQEVYGDLYNAPGDIFKSQYLTAIDEFYQGNVTLSELGTFLVTRLFFDHGAVKPKFMFKDSVLQELTTDPDHPLRIALSDNDTYDWAPAAPTRLLYCTGDEVVPFENSIIADSVMRANGASDVEAIDVDSEAGHGECGNPAVMLSSAFFDSFVTTSGIATGPAPVTFSIAPNPARATFTISTAEPMASDMRVELSDISGRVIRRWDSAVSGDYAVGHLLPGMYIVRISDGDRSGIQRILIH